MSTEDDKANRLRQLSELPEEWQLVRKLMHEQVARYAFCSRKGDCDAIDSVILQIWDTVKR